MFYKKNNPAENGKKMKKIIYLLGIVFATAQGGYAGNVDDMLNILKKVDDQNIKAIEAIKEKILQNVDSMIKELKSTPQKRDTRKLYENIDPESLKDLMSRDSMVYDSTHFKFDYLEKMRNLIWGGKTEKEIKDISCVDAKEVLLDCVTLKDRLEKEFKKEVQDTKFPVGLLFPSDMKNVCNNDRMGAKLEEVQRLGCMAEILKDYPKEDIEQNCEAIVKREFCHIWDGAEVEQKVCREIINMYKSDSENKKQEL